MEVVASGKPYITYGDQYIETEKWPDPKCKCKGQGTYGTIAPRGTAENELKLGGNLPCICGSGTKYKKCCRERVERLTKGGHHILICKCVGESFLALNPFVEDMRKELADKWKITTPPLDNSVFNPSGATSTPKIDPTSELSASSPTLASLPEMEKTDSTT